MILDDTRSLSSPVKCEARLAAQLSLQITPPRFFFCPICFPKKSRNLKFLQDPKKSLPILLKKILPYTRRNIFV
jgi:hypothetical protein